MLTIDQLKQRAPSVFALEPWAKVSESYRFMPTIDVVHEMMDKGFVVTSAMQSRCRLEGKENFTKHVIRFRHADFAEVTDRKALMGVPEVVLMNSHDRTSSYQIMLGMFRQVCQNGLIAFAEDIGFTVRHTGHKDIAKEVIDASFKVIDSGPKVLKEIDRWTNKTITRPQQLAFAQAALELRDTKIITEPALLLEGRRHYDDAQPNGNRDIWTTFNVVQENIIRGGVAGQSQTTGKFRRTRSIKSVGEDVKLNRALWRLTEELAKAA